MPAAQNRELRIVVLTAWGLLSGWTWLAGKDVSWDLINHHLYLPFAWWTGRHAADLYAAGPQSYQVPLGYLPLHALVEARLPDWGVGLALATLHALAAWPLWHLARALWPGPDQFRWRALAVAMGLVTPVFLVYAGTSSMDPLTCVLVLAALAWVWGDRPQAGPAMLAGVAFGAAVGLKPTNLVLVPALLAVLLLRTAAGLARPRAMLAGAAAAVGTSVALIGPWSWWLWSTYGNPALPFLNDRFASPFAPSGPMIDLRFKADSATALLTRPFEWLAPQAYLHTEAVAPDLRPAALLLCAAALAAAACRSRWRRPWPRFEWRPWAAARPGMGLFVVLSYIPWLFGSGNSRYLMPVFMLAGPLLLAAASALAAQRTALAACALLLVTQVALHLAEASRRIFPQRWDGGPYLSIDVPERLRHNPFLHLSISTPSLAGIAPRLHRDGAFVNLIGPMSLPADGALGEALQQRLRHWQGRTRLLVLLRGSDPRHADAGHERTRMDRAVQRFGLAFDWQDCEAVSISAYGLPRPDKPPPEPVRALSCAAVTGVAADPAVAAERARVDAAFRAAEGQCPLVLGPRPLATDREGDGWQRRYLNSNARLSASLHNGVSLTHFRSHALAWLGPVDEVAAGRGKPACQAWKELDVH